MTDFSVWTFLPNRVDIYGFRTSAEQSWVSCWLELMTQLTDFCLPFTNYYRFQLFEKKWKWIFLERNSIRTQLEIFGNRTFQSKVYNAVLPKKLVKSCLIPGLSDCSVRHLQQQVLIHNLNQAIWQVYQNQWLQKLVWRLIWNYGVICTDFYITNKWTLNLLFGKWFIFLAIQK